MGGFAAHRIVYRRSVGATLALSWLLVSRLSCFHRRPERSPCFDAGLHLRPHVFVERRAAQLWGRQCSQCMRRACLLEGETAELQDGKPRIVAMLASHLADDIRLWKLRRCLDSIRMQSDPPDAVLVHWSAAPGFAEDAEQLFSKFASGLSCPVVVRSGNQASQFEHYAALRHELAEYCRGDAASTWVIFSDDDDVWHPRRSAHFGRAAASAIAVGQPAACIFRDARPGSEEVFPASAREVEALLRAGNAEQTGDVAAVQAGFRLEYFHYCVQTRVLNDFFERALPTVLASPYCDLALAEYVRLRCLALGDLTLYDPGARDWMYFYDRAPGAEARDVAGGEPTELENACVAANEVDVANLGIPLPEAPVILARLRTNTDALLLEAFPVVDQARALGILVPMLLDREDVDLVPLLQVNWLVDRDRFVSVHGHLQVQSAERLVIFYLKFFVDKYGLCCSDASEL